jgi:hypothetical protein
MLFIAASFVMCRLEMWAVYDSGYNQVRLYFTDVQGGFARVYEVQDVQKQRRALKVVSKASIKTKRNEGERSTASVSEEG